MNLLLAINAGLLLLVLAFQQWYSDYWQSQGINELTFVQQIGFNTQCFLIHYVSPLANTNYFYFFLAGFAIPVIASIKTRSWHLEKKAVLSLWVVNPCLFAIVGFHYSASLEPSSGIVPKLVSVHQEYRPRLSLLPSFAAYFQPPRQ